jgi:4-amino-4-deoxy-L-arabinose transferase-like glycosyltransferase
MKIARNTQRSLLLTWLALFLVLGLLTADVYPSVNYNMTDEIWAMNSSVTYVDGERKASVVEPSFYFMALGLFQKLLGKGIMQARAFSLLVATLVLYLTYLLGRELKDEWTGLLSSVVLGTAFAFTWHSRVIRSEMLTTAFIVAAIYLLCYAFKREKHWPVFAGGLVAALAVHAHPNSLQYSIAIVPVFVVIFRKRAASAAMLYLLGGLLTGVAVWLAINYFPSRPEDWEAADSVAKLPGVYPFPVLNENFFDLFLRSLKRWPGDYLQYSRLFDVFYPNRISFAVVGVAAFCVWGLSAFTAARWKVLSIVGLVALTNFIVYFITNKYGFWHMLELYPFLAVATVIGLCGVRDRLTGKAGTAVLAAGVLFFAGVGVADTAMAYNSMRGYDYYEFIGRVTAKIDGRTLGRDFYAPAFEKEDFVVHWFNTINPKMNCPPFEEKARELGVEYVIVDDVLRSLSRRACGRRYEGDMLRFFYVRAEPVDWAPIMYPSYWAKGGMISEIYVFKIPSE